MAPAFMNILRTTGFYLSSTQTMADTDLAAQISGGACHEGRGVHTSKPSIFRMLFLFNGYHGIFAEFLDMKYVTKRLPAVPWS